MDELNKYIEYLKEKLEIEFGEGDDESNESIIRNVGIKTSEKMSKSNLQIKIYEITKYIIKSYKCYNIIDMEKSKCLDQDDISELCDQYIKYKQNDKISGVVPELKMDNNINTLDTFYIDTLNITTNMLKSRYGDLIKTGDETSKHRYEYKFVLTYKNKKYVYCLYDYKCEGEFEKEEDINWHIGCNVDKKEVTKIFIHCLKNELNNITEDE